MHSMIPIPTPDRTAIATFVAGVPVVYARALVAPVAGVRVIPSMAIPSMAIPSMAIPSMAIPASGRLHAGVGQRKWLGSLLGRGSKQSEFVNLKVAVH